MCTGLISSSLLVLLSVLVEVYVAFFYCCLSSYIIFFTFNCPIVLPVLLFCYQSYIIVSHPVHLLGLYYCPYSYIGTFNPILVALVPHCYISPILSSIYCNIYCSHQSFPSSLCYFSSNFVKYSYIVISLLSKVFLHRGLKRRSDQHGQCMAGFHHDSYSSKEHGHRLN